MARPRIFVSSTFYDLRQVRADIERFIREMGYEPVLHERAQIPYGPEERREEYAYREIESCDVVVSIIGGRFGTESQDVPYSISQMELKTALELGRQVYIFVERSVLSEYSTYLKNKGVESVQYSFVDNVGVYVFLEEVHSLPMNNTIAPFETSRDISDYLREQWAGLFQRYLQEQGRLREASLVEGMRATADTLDQLVTFLTEERRSQDEAIKSILLSTHPAFARLKVLLNVQYRVFFTNHDEFVAWLGARGYRLVNPEAWDEPGFEEWSIREPKRTRYLHVSRSIFDEDGKLKVYTSSEWSDDWAWIEVIDDPVEDEEDSSSEVEPSPAIRTPRRSAAAARRVRS